MAIIDEYLSNIQSATYGEEVRQSIHDAIEAINDEAGTLAQERVDLAVESALSEVDAELSNLKSALYSSDIVWTDGGYISSQDGAIIPYDNWHYSSFIDISDYKNGILYQKRSVSVAHPSEKVSGYNAFYTEEGAFISSFLITTDGGFVAIPPTAKYVRVSERSDVRVTIADYNEEPYIKSYYYAANVVQSVNIPVSVAKYDLVVPDGLTVSVIQCRSDGSVVSQSNYSGGNRTIYCLNNVSYIILRTNYSGGALKDINHISLTEKPLGEKLEYLRFMTFNVGKWYNGITKIPDDLVPQRQIDWRKFLGSWNADLIGMQEAPSTIDESNSIYCSSMIYSKYPYGFADNRNHDNRVNGKHIITNNEVLSFPSGSGRMLIRFNYNFGGVKITFYMAHLSIEANTSGVRQEDLAYLKSLLTGADHTVIFGDFNTYDMSELSIFSDYNICNGGDFGTFDTWPHTTDNWPNAAIDNIITTKDISIQNVELGNVSLSDHKPLIADLCVYY